EDARDAEVAVRDLARVRSDSPRTRVAFSGLRPFRLALPVVRAELVVGDPREDLRDHAGPALRAERARHVRLGHAGLQALDYSHGDRLRRVALARRRILALRARARGAALPAREAAADHRHGDSL